MKRPRAAGIMARAGAVPFSGLLGAVLAIPLLAGPAGAQQPLAQTGGDLPVRAVRQIEALLAAKAQRTPAQRKVSSQFLEAQRTTAQRAVNSQPLDEQRTPTQRTMNSQLLDALRTPLREPTAAGTALLQATDPYAKDERVMVDIRADVTPAVLARIQSLGGTVINSVPRYQSIRARLPLAALEPLATLEAVQFIRPADQPITDQVLQRSDVARAVVATSKVNTSEGDVAHQANVARQTYTVDGTGIGIGVISDGVETLADQQATGDVPGQVFVLPGQEGGSFDLACGGRSSGTEGTALFEIVHDLAPGADLFFATGGGGRAQMAQNIEDLCAAGADIIVDDIGYLGASAFQDDVIAKAITAAAANGCFYFSSAGNAGNLNDATAGVWEGDFANGGTLSLNGLNSGAVVHDFGGGVTGNRIKTNSTRPIILQWADPVDGSANDYDLFLIDADDNVLASSTSTQDGTQDPIEYIGGSCSNDREDNRLVIVKNSGAEDRYVRLNYARGGLEIATAGQTFGHSASKDAIGVAAVDVGDAGGAGGVFDGTESVETFSSDGLRRIFFEADGTPITAGNFLASTDGGRVLQKPDLAAADGVSTSTPGFSTFRGTSAAAPHAAAIAALMLEAAGGPANVTPAALRTAMTGAALDIEATGVDRDSGAGIVMAPGAVDAVDVAVADRNGAPTVSGTISDRTFAPGDAALTIDLTSVFSDPDNDTLTYTVWSSDNARLSVSAVTGTSFTLTPVSPGRMVVAVVAADPESLIAVLTFVVTVTNTTGAPNTAPQITSPSSFDVRENQSVVRRLVARDTDPGDEVTGWVIVGGADQGQFMITSDTGDLSFRTAPDFEAPGDNEYEVTVEVRSGAGARELEAEQTFTVRVTDEREPPGIPEAPTFSGETAESMTVNWSEPDNTGPAITDYDVRYREKGTGRFIDGQHEGPGRSLTLDNLEPGTAYEVQVRATNDEGTSDWSESGEGMTVTPLTVQMTTDLPPPVEGPFTMRFRFSETVRGFTSNDIETQQEPACTDSANNPVFCNPSFAALQTTDDRIFTTTVTPRTDQVNHNYTLTLTVPAGRVTSAAGNKPNEEAMLEVRVAPPGVTVPISSIGLTANSGNGQVTLRWNTPTNTGGAPIVRYEYRWAESGGEFGDWMRVDPSERSATVPNLTNGREYVFEVRGVNALGYGPVETASATPESGGGGGGFPQPPRPPANNRPMADAGPDQTGVREGALVTLDGSGSSDPDDDPLKYRWNQYRGERVALSSRDVVNPTFTAPRELTADVVLNFRLLVTDPSGRFDSDTVTITVEQGSSPPLTEDRIYYFPHLAVGASWQTTITYINYSREEVTCQTDFISDHGTPLMVSFAELGTVDSRTDVLPPGGSVHQETNVDLSAPLAPGWALANCSGPVKASLLYRQHNSERVPTAEAGANAAAVPATRFVTFAEQGEGQFGTGVAYANPSDTSATVTFTARDAAGEVLASVDRTLSPGGHDAHGMGSLFGPTSFTGSIEVTSTEPIVSLSLNFEADPVFSSLPPGELDDAAQGSTTYYFPHLAVGASWQTTITYINYSPDEVTCQTDFISDHGTPLMVSFAALGTVVSRTDVLPPGGSVHQETNVDLNASLAPGWARATCSGPVKASLLFRLHNSEGAPTAEAGVNAAAVPATRFVTFAEQGEDQFGTGVAYANPSAISVPVTFTARDAAGELLASVVRTLSPGGHDAHGMAELFGSPVLPDRSKSSPRSPSSVCRSISKPIPSSPPCLRGNWMLPSSDRGPSKGGENCKRFAVASQTGNLLGNRYAAVATEPVL